MNSPEPSNPAPDLATLEKLKEHLSALDPETLESIGRLSEAMKSGNDQAKLQYMKENQEQILKDRDRLIEAFSSAGLITPKEAEEARNNPPPGN